MAIRGVNLSEREAVIHPDDPGHPDNIEIEVETRIRRKAGVSGRTADLKPGELKEALDAVSEDEKRDIRDAVEKNPEFIPTKYFIGVLAATDRTELGDMVAAPTMRDNGITLTPRNNERIAEIVRRGLKGWENQQDAEGNVIQFETATAQNIKGRPMVVAADKSIASLPVLVVNWLANEISRKNGMTNELAKKSSGVSPQSLDQLFGTGDAPSVMTSSVENAAAPDQPSDD